jgi:UDP-N-acetylmuramoylalanine--D-glutamate ligase
VATITNVTPDHFDRHPDFEDYLETKLRLLAKMGAGNAIIMNVDEPSLPIATMHAMANHAHFVGFSPSGKTSLPPWPNLSPGATSRDGDWATFGTQEIPRDGLRAPGEHNLINAMTAWEMAVAFMGRPTRAQEESMMADLLAFRGIEHRMELVGERDGVRVYNNSMCTNPAALIASSKGLGGRQHLLVGGLRKNLDFTPAGQYFADAPHKVYIFGPDPGALNHQLGGLWPVYNTLEDAFLAAIDKAKPGEIIILAPGCASADPYPNFRDRGEAFKSMAKEWLST